MENASVALLMLDIASAKSTLKQLHQSYTAASEEHQRTKIELQDLKQELDVDPLYTLHGSKGSAAADRSTAQQLQALHTENLQLKSLLKQEIESRQQLEQQHATLLQLIRSCGVQDILKAAALLPATAEHAKQAAQHPRQQHEQQQVPHQVESVQVCQGVDSAAGGVLQEGPAAGISTHASTSSWSVSSTHATAQQAAVHNSSMCANAASSTQAQSTATDQQNDGANNLQRSRSASDGAMLKEGCQELQHNTQSCSSSAYFPQHHKQYTQLYGSWAATAAGQSARPAVHNRAFVAPHDSSLARDGAAACTQPIVSQQGVHGPASWGSSNSSSSISRQLFTQLQQQPHQPTHQEQQAGAAMPGWGQSTSHEAAAATDAYASVPHESNSSCSSVSLSGSCSQSQASELLDSSDLEELASLCDGLINQQHIGNHMPEAFAAAATGAAGVRGGAPAKTQIDNMQYSSSSSGLGQQAGQQPLQNPAPKPCQPGLAKQQHMQLPQMATSQVPKAGGVAAQQQQDGSVQQSAQQFALPDLGLISARLQKLQQQVAMDAGLRKRQNSSSSGSSANPAVIPDDRLQGSQAATGAAEHGTGISRPTVAASLSGEACIGAATAQGSSRNNSNSWQRHSLTSMVHAAGVSGNSSHTLPVSREGSTCGEAVAQQPEADSSVMINLQQQLAQRMLEVKQRLSNICNGMLEEALGTDDADAIGIQQTAAGVAAQAEAAPARPAYCNSGATAPTAATKGNLAAVDSSADMQHPSNGPGSLRSHWRQQQQQHHKSAEHVPLHTTEASTKQGPAHSVGFRGWGVLPSADADSRGSSSYGGRHAQQHGSKETSHGAGTHGSSRPAMYHVHAQARSGVPPQASAAAAATGEGSITAGPRQGSVRPRVEQPAAAWSTLQQQEGPCAAGAEQAGTTAAAGPGSGSIAAGGQHGAEVVHASNHVNWPAMDGSTLHGSQPTAMHMEQPATADESEACSNSSWATVEEGVQPPAQTQDVDAEDEVCTPPKHWRQQQHVPAWQQQHQQTQVGDIPQRNPHRTSSGSSSSSNGDCSSGGSSPIENPVRLSKQAQQQHYHHGGGVSESLEGVLFGIGGRVAAEVSQTFSPMKGGTPAGQAFRVPGSPATPLKPRNI